MARVSRLSLSGFPGRFTNVVVAAVGLAAAGATVSGVSDSAGIGTGSALARVIPSGVGGAIIAAVGSATASGTALGYATKQISHLTPRGTTGRFFPTPNKQSIIHKSWAVSETLGISWNIADFDSRHFYLVDTLVFDLTSSVAHVASGATALVTVTANGVGASRNAQAGGAFATVTASGYGATVITLTGVGTATGTVTANADGSSVGNIFSLGAGSSAASVTATAVGESTAQGKGVAQATVLGAGVGFGPLAAVGTATATVTALGTGSTAAIGAASASVVAQGVGAKTFGAVGLSHATVDVQGIAEIPPPPPSLAAVGGIQIDVGAPSMLIEVTSQNMKVEVAA